MSNVKESKVFGPCGRLFDEQIGQTAVNQPLIKRPPGPETFDSLTFDEFN